MAADDIPDTPQRRDISFYFVFLFLVFPFWASVPFAWTFVTYALLSGRIWYYTLPRLACFAIALSEVIFSVYHHQLVQEISGPTNIGHGSVPEIQLAFQRILKAGLADLPKEGFDEETLDTQRPGSPAELITQLDENDPRAIDFRNILRTWFGRNPWSTMRLLEVQQWIYWSIFSKELEEENLPQSHKAVLDDTVDLLQKRLGKPIPEGSNPSNRPMLLNIDKPNVLWRPFTFYAISMFVNILLDQWYQRSRNFYRGKYAGLEYLVRIPPTWQASRDPSPVVFLHGLGLGLLQYHSFLSHLTREFVDRPLLILLQPHISQNIFHPKYLQPMPRKEFTKTLVGLLALLGWAELEPAPSKDDQDKSPDFGRDGHRGVTLLSHSNGSYAHAWILKDYPHAIRRSCFVDPVTFCGWEGDVCRNFFYKTCTTGTELLVRYFVGTELGVVNLLQRNFDWSSNSLWYEEIPNARDPSKTLFLLGDKDSIVSTERVKLYLRSHGVRKGLWIDPNGRHGQALLAGGAGCKMVYDWIREREI